MCVFAFILCIRLRWTERLGLRFGGASSHPGCFIFGSESLQWELSVFLNNSCAWQICHIQHQMHSSVSSMRSWKIMLNRTFLLVSCSCFQTSEWGQLWNHDHILSNSCSFTPFNCDKSKWGKTFFAVIKEKSSNLLWWLCCAEMRSTRLHLETGKWQNMHFHQWPKPSASTSESRLCPKVSKIALEMNIFTVWCKTIASTSQLWLAVLLAAGFRCRLLLLK